MHKHIVLILITIISFSFAEKLEAQLTSDEKESLIYMYEEEKLAHDVYSKLSEKYALPIFNNITKSEAYHMSLVLDLIKKNNLKDPSGLEIGKFNNQHLQEIYNSLTTKGDKSVTDALNVGASIEDLDIFDLEKFLYTTINEELLKIYKTLICGSENHMRAFSRHLKSREQVYTPKYISKTRYESILIAKHKPCIELNN